MNNDQKSEIQKLLQAYVAERPSQAKAVQSLKNVSEATAINVLKGRWESITDDMWRNIGKQVGLSAKEKWQMLQTTSFKNLVRLLDDAKEYNNVFAIVSPAGSGKTYTSMWYEKSRNNVFHIVCAEYFNRKVFLSKLLEKLGKDGSGSVNEMMENVIESFLKLEDPIIILDEADKLNDTVLYFFITLYNMLYGKCAIAMLATDYLAKRITRGRKLNKKGYAEIYSRIGRRFINIGTPTEDEIKEMCRINGVTDKSTLQSIVNEHEGDLRRVERAVHKAKKKAA